MPSLIARICKFESRRRVRRDHLRGAALVSHLRVAMNVPALPAFLPRGVRVEQLGAGPLRGEALRVETPREAVLYLHGGGYVAGHPRVYRNLCSRLAKGLSADVFVPEYRLAPEHPFPAGLDDCHTASRIGQIGLPMDRSGALNAGIQLRDLFEPVATLVRLRVRVRERATGAWGKSFWSLPLPVVLKP